MLSVDRFMVILTTFVALLQLTRGKALTQEGWYEQHPLLGGQAGQLNAVCFIDANTATAVAGDGSILRTTDGGSTWRNQVSGTKGRLLSVCFVDTMTGTAVGLGGTIISTTDGGITWVREPTGVPYAYRGVCFTDAHTGTVVGNGIIVRTTNGGFTWVQQLAGLFHDLYSVCFIDAMTGTAVGEGGTILHTDDGGSTWIQQPSGTTASLRGVSLADENSGMVVGDEVILRTTDGGATWVRQSNEIADGTLLFDVALSGANTGIAVGAGRNSAGEYIGGVILRTTNGGVNWERQLIDFPYAFYGVSSLDSNTTLVVGGYGSEGMVCRTTDGGSTWPTWLILSRAMPATLSGVYSVDANVATAVGGTILRTTDGGTTWTEQKSGTYLPLRDVCLTDGNTGIAVGGDVGGDMFDWGVQYQVILRTTDGGVAWVSRSSGNTQMLLAVSCIDADTGTAVGANGTILRTTDGGATWAEQESGTSHWLHDVCFTDENTGTVVGGGVWGSFGDWGEWGEEGQAILRTTDGGVTWVSQSSGTTQGLWAVSCIDAHTGAAVGEDGIIVHTTNGGTDWMVQPSGTAHCLRGVCFTDAYTGVAVGDGGTILRTTDGGTTWAIQSSGTSHDLNDVSFVDATTGTAVGTGGLILRTTTGGVTWVEENRPVDGELPQDFTLHQNYPNPFNPSTTIEFGLPHAGVVTLKVYNVLGREVANLVEGNHPAGTFKATWDASGLPSGVYFYRLTVGEYVQTKKMVCLR